MNLGTLQVTAYDMTVQSLHGSSNSIGCHAGSALLTAGYCLYSSSTIFVLTTGKGVYGFTLDPLVGEFILSHDNVKVRSSLR